MLFAAAKGVPAPGASTPRHGRCRRIHA